MTTTAIEALDSAAVAPVSLVSRAAARMAFAGGLFSLVLLSTLHVLRPDLDPASHLASEYAVGEHSWAMTLCFLSLAVGSAGLLPALLQQVRSAGGRIGLAFLAAAAVGLGMAAMFPMDPITTAPEAATVSGKMHGVSAMIGIPSLVIAALVLGLALRRNPLWEPVRRPLLVSAHLTWISLAVMAGLLALAMQQGADGSGGYFGWANRALIFAYGIWVMIAAWPTARGGR